MRHEEDRIQEAMVNAIRYLYPKSIIAAVPNGGYRSAKEGARFKRQGVLSGFADLIFIHKGKIHFFEVKKEQGGVQSANQKAFQKNVTEQGFGYYIVKSVDEILDIIKKL